MMSSDGFEEVLGFWFPENAGTNHDALVRQFGWWFGGGANATVAERYPVLLERAARGDLDHWAAMPRSRLALIIVPDQFSRSLYPDSARAYAQDPKALALALEGIDNGQYAQLATPWERIFFSLPLGHSEELVHLERVVELAEELVHQASPQWRRMLQHSASQARGHRDVVARFGRQPHRNRLLGRRSTPEELAYIERGEFVHRRPLPEPDTVR
jgi:uncharacterized protein (DUF924 family)